MYTNRVFGTAKSVLFIEIPLFQGVLINEGFHSIYIYSVINFFLDFPPSLL